MRVFWVKSAVKIFKLLAIHLNNEQVANKEAADAIQARKENTEVLSDKI